MGSRLRGDTLQSSRPVMEFSADLLLMLLSTDWFSPCARQLGFPADESQAPRARTRLRAEVARMLHGADQIHDMDFDFERASRTRKELLDTIDEFGRSSRLSAVARQILDGGVYEQGTYSSQLALLNQRILSGENAFLGDLGAELKARLVWAVQRSLAPLDAVSTDSASAWDRQLFARNRDNPEFLADFASEQLGPAIESHAFQDILLAQLTLAERYRVQAAYVQDAASMGLEFEPSWAP